MKTKSRLIAIAASTLGMLNASAAMVSGSVGNITHLYSYSTSGNGDVAVVVTSSLAGCSSGFWLRSSDPGFKSVYAQLVSARLTQTPIKIWAYDDQPWPQSQGQFCRIEAIDLDM